MNPDEEPLLAPGAPTTAELALIERLRAGDEAAFVTLVDQHHASMVRLAMNYVGARTVAEEVAQEAWLGVLKGIARFEGRSSLKTWIYRILTNTAKTRGERESRVIPFSLFEGNDDGSPSVAPERFLPEGGESPGAWRAAPAEWSLSPEQMALSGEVQGIIREAMARLAPAQCEVMRLRDIEGWTAEDVCNVLNISETNQRVLLHRARSRVRAALEAYFGGE